MALAQTKASDAASLLGAAQRTGTRHEFVEQLRIFVVCLTERLGQWAAAAAFDLAALDLEPAGPLP
jgi:hypothetical protein